MERYDIIIALKTVLCYGRVISIYVSEKDWSISIVIEKDDKKRFKIIGKASWRIVNRNNRFVVIGQYDMTYVLEELINNLLCEWVEKEKHIHIQDVSISQMSDLFVVLSNGFILEVFVSGFEDIEEWRIDDLTINQSICTQSLKQLIFFG